MHRFSWFARASLRAAVAAIALGGAFTSRAWCANLWLAAGNFDRVESFTAKQLAASGTPLPAELQITLPTAMVFDSGHNLWVVSNHVFVEKFTPTQLKALGTVNNPAPALTITSSEFQFLLGGAFDKHGNLWVVDTAKNEIVELAKAQLQSGGTLTPQDVIGAADFDSPRFIAFDKSGNAWVASAGNARLIEFAAAQLTHGGVVPPHVELIYGAQPSEIVFDHKGDLWVPELGDNTVVKFTPAQLASSGSPAPAVILSSVAGSLDGPVGAAFQGANLIIYNQSTGTISKFSAKQLKTSGAPTPAVFLSADPGGFSIISGPAS
jgi:streptogramin lyase